MGTVYYPASVDEAILMADKGKILTPAELELLKLQEQTEGKLTERGLPLEEQAKIDASIRLGLPKGHRLVGEVRTYFDYRAAQELSMRHELNGGGLVMQLEVEGETVKVGGRTYRKPVPLYKVKEIYLTPKANERRDEVMDAFKDLQVVINIG